AVVYSAFPGSGKITIRFEAIARPDFSALERRAPAWVRNAGWHVDGMATVVEFETDPESVFHDFREGTRIAIDVLAPKTDASVYAQTNGRAAESVATPITSPEMPMP